MRLTISGVEVRIRRLGQSLSDLLTRHRLRYIPGNKAEDCVLNPLCFYHANAVCSLPVDAYYYRMRSQSVSHHVDNQKRIIESPV